MIAACDGPEDRDPMTPALGDYEKEAGRAADERTCKD